MKVWRGFFAFASVYNLGVGAIMAAAPERVAGQLGVTGPGGAYAIAMVGLLIAVFGVGYAMVSYAPSRNRGIVWIGLIGKLGAVTLGSMQYAAGIVPASTFALAMGDLAFAAMFALFLWRGPRLA